MMDKKLYDQMLRSPLASTDPSLGNYALSQAVWSGVKKLINK
ncbi:hypothetical protein [Bifidobacterium pullorum]|nr:hypothetical protein [Bifidobacterium pullorum]